MRFLVMRKESIATSETASTTLCTVHVYLISESLNKVNLSVLQDGAGSAVGRGKRAEAVSYNIILFAQSSVS